MIPNEQDISGPYDTTLSYIDHHHVSTYQQANFSQKQRPSGKRQKIIANVIGYKMKLSE